MQRRLLVYAVLAVTTGGVNSNSAHSLPTQPESTSVLAPARLDQSYAQQQRRHAQESYKSLKFAEAAGRLKNLINAGSNEACDHYWLGESYFHLGKYADAAASFRQASKLDPKMDNAKVRMAESYLATKDLRETHEASREAMATVREPYALKQLQIIHDATNRKDPPTLIFRPSSEAESPNNGNK